MLTNKQSLEILDFFSRCAVRTLESVQEELAEDSFIEHTSVRVYDSACCADVFSKLANMHMHVNDHTMFTFTPRDVVDAMWSLDTDYRDVVYKQFMSEMDESLCSAVFGS